MFIMPIEFSLVPDRATTTIHSRLAHYAIGPSRLPFHLPGGLGGSIRPSGAGRVGTVFGLAKVSIGALAV